jgi:hypothetical protein
MLNINQNVVFGDLVDGAVATIVSSRGFTIYAVTGSTAIEQLNADGTEQLSVITLAEGKSIEVVADSGNLLNNIRITAGTSTQYVLLGGAIQV